jgi:hypothetical protein
LAAGPPEYDCRSRIDANALNVMGMMLAFMKLLLCGEILKNRC